MRGDGIIGFVKGTFAGSFHLCAMTASGLAAGLYQVVRGMERTFEAVRATKEGKVWDFTTKEWFFFLSYIQILIFFCVGVCTNCTLKSAQKKNRLM